MKNIAVLTSGGDAPGMNACVRSIVRTANFFNLNVYGIQYGYDGLINNNINLLTNESVGNTIHLGGTILKTARSEFFREKSGRKIAYDNIVSKNIDGLIILGGDGSITGAGIFSEEFNIPVLGIPCTIDNDLYGTDYSIGFATARETIVSAIDKIRDTASSHDRIFIVEVMGRESGFLALESGVASGAEIILLPEKKVNISDLINSIKKVNRDKRSIIIIYAEGCKLGSVEYISKQISDKINGTNVRYSILGHIQRGGTATPSDRILGTILGNHATKNITKGENKKMVGIINNKVILTPFNEVINNKKDINDNLYQISKIISNY